MVSEVEAEELDEKKEHDGSELELPDRRGKDQGSTNHYKI